jgi:hypothetical protein
MRTVMTRLHDRDMAFEATGYLWGSTPLDVFCCKLLFATRLLTPGSETTVCHLFCSRH